jgi:hypothetical protein
MEKTNREDTYKHILNLLLEAELAARNGQWKTCGTYCRRAMDAAFAVGDDDKINQIKACELQRGRK